jgi:hypothetical protein
MDTDRKPDVKLFFTFSPGFLETVQVTGVLLALPLAAACQM